MDGITSIAIETFGGEISTIRLERNGLTTIGTLPDGYKFVPASVKDALQMADWLRWYATQLSQKTTT